MYHNLCRVATQGKQGILMFIFPDGGNTRKLSKILRIITVNMALYRNLQITWDIFEALKIIGCARIVLACC